MVVSICPELFQGSATNCAQVLTGRLEGKDDLGARGRIAGEEEGLARSPETYIVFARSAQAAKARTSERTRVLSQS